MKKNDLNFLDYVKAAFNRKFKIPLLGHIPVNKFLLAGFGILGFGHPGFWFLGLAYEAAYLLFLSGSKRFQKVVQGEHLKKNVREVEHQREELFDKLGKDEKSRYLTFNKNCSDIVSQMAHLPGDTPLNLWGAHSLDQLKMIMLKLLNTSRKTRKTIDMVNKTALVKEIGKLEKQIKELPEDSPVRKSLTGTYDIQKKRQQNLEKAEINLKITEAEINRIENQLKLLKEETAISTNADLLTSHIDSVISTMHQTAQWMSDHSELFGNMEDEPLMAEFVPRRQKETT